MPMAAPPESISIDMRPSSVTSIGGNMTCPPRAPTAAAVASASAVARYTDQVSGIGESGSFCMQPAIHSPSREKLT